MSGDAGTEAWAWRPTDQGVVQLPSGTLVRGRSLRTGADRSPGWGLYLSRPRPESTPWPSRWLRWPDFGVPADAGDALAALSEAYHRCARERVEIACSGGVGRTGTALAALAMLDGLSQQDAVAWTRERYHPRAVETPWQRRWLARHLTGA